MPAHGADLVAGRLRLRINRHPVAAAKIPIGGFASVKPGSLINLLEFPKYCSLISGVPQHQPHALIAFSALDHVAELQAELSHLVGDVG